jgi:GxxExxY protein
LKHRGTEDAEGLGDFRTLWPPFQSGRTLAKLCWLVYNLKTEVGGGGRVELNEISGRIIAAAMKVHTAIGAGVLESVYQSCLHHELKNAGLSVQAQVALPVVYGGMHLDSGYRIDLLVEETVVVELKCVESLLPIHKAQLLTYLRLANKPLGLLLNFNVVHMRYGIKRVLNNKLAYKASQSS